MRNFRLLMTTDTCGGVWTYALELVQTLVPRYEVLLATMGNPLSPSQSRAARAIRGLTVCESDYKLEWMEDPWADVDASGRWLMELAHAFRPDLVHLNTYAHGALPWKAPVVMVGHSCVYSWWHAVKQCAPPAAWQEYHRRVRAGLQSADLVIAPSWAMLRALTAHYGPLGESRVIYNARQPIDFMPEAKNEFILAIGRLWDEAKNVSILEQAAPRLPWPVYVAGEQQHPNGGRLELSQLRPLGQLDPVAVRTWLARAALYALPARYEPFGLSALEAALSGCALVLGDIDSLREVWGDTVQYVPPDDADAVGEVLRELIYRPHHRRALATAARRRAFRYVPSTMGAAYSAAYHELLNAGKTLEKSSQKIQEGSLATSPAAAHPELAGVSMRF